MNKPIWTISEVPLSIFSVGVLATQALYTHNSTTAQDTDTVFTHEKSIDLLLFF